MSERLSGALGRAHRAGELVHIELGALTRNETRELLGEAVDDAEASALYNESGGNPFYLEQLARSRGRAESASAPLEFSLSGPDVPPAVVTALAEEIALLSKRARLILDGAAVAGDPFDPELAAAAAAISEASALEAVDEVLKHGLVRQTDVPRRFRFRHPLVRRAVYESAPAGWRLGAHERCAGALEARGSPPAARAHHVERFGRQGDASAVASLREAGEAAAKHAPASAARWFESALRLLPGNASGEERVELLLARAGALAVCGHFAEAHSALLESIELVPKDAVSLRVRLTASCAGVEHLLGRHEDAHQRLARALDSLDDARSAEAAALMIELALDGVYRMELERIGDWAEPALDVARSLGDKPLAASAASLLAWGASMSGAIPKAEAYRSEAAALVDELSDHELALRLDSAVNLAGAELYLDRFDEAGSHCERVVAVARATGQPAFVPFAFMLLAWVRMLRGELAAGGEMLDAAVEEARLLGNAQSLAGLLLNRSLTAVLAGDVEVAVSTAEESVELTHGLDSGLVPAATGLALVAARLEAGDPGLAAAVELMLARSGGEEIPLMPGGSFRAKWLELLTRCRLALGQPADAERAAACAQATATSMGGLRMAQAMADRAAAAIAFHRGEYELAAEQALASAASADAVGIPVEAALSRTLAGRALGAAGQRERAIIELQLAAAVFDSCGARRYRDAAEQELRNLGQRIHRRTKPGKADGTEIEALTERERQVARLIVDRKTNREIAADLFLSLKTVETHIHNIFTKLRVTSRADLARTVERSDRSLELSRPAG